MFHISLSSKKNLCLEVCIDADEKYFVINRERFDTGYSGITIDDEGFIVEYDPVYCSYYVLKDVNRIKNIEDVVLKPGRITKKNILSLRVFLEIKEHND